MNKQEKLKEILFSEFDKLIEGSDIYDHRGSKWIIFTNEKRWVVEFTKEKTLWFNYHRFNEVMVLFAMDCNEDRNYIKEWYERRFIFNHKVKNGVTGVFKAYFERRNLDDTIQNGVKDIIDGLYRPVHDTIQNGVKNTLFNMLQEERSVEDTIQNGVIESLSFLDDCHLTVEDTIQNGVKVTKSAEYNEDAEDTIQNGVKVTKYMSDGLVLVEGIIQNGVKETLFAGGDNNYEIDDTIQNGVKDTNYRLVFDQQGIECAIENNINELDPRFFQLDGIVEDTIQNGVRSTAPVMDKAWSQVDNTIQNGVKITKGVNFISDDCFDDIIQNGVNVISWAHPTANHSNQVYDIIQNGVKHIQAFHSDLYPLVEGAITKGVKC